MSFAPVYGPGSRALILGSWPSPKSWDMGFYYGHPHNRFWPLLARLTGEALPAREHPQLDAAPEVCRRICALSKSTLPDRLDLELPRLLERPILVKKR